MNTSTTLPDGFVNAPQAEEQEILANDRFKVRYEHEMSALSIACTELRILERNNRPLPANEKEWEEQKKRLLQSFLRQLPAQTTDTEKVALMEANGRERLDMLWPSIRQQMTRLATEWANHPADAALTT